jgi:hypothetical protein
MSAASWVRGFCAIAPVLLGVAHQVPALAADPTDPANLAEYILPDGTLPTLCITLPASQSPSKNEQKAHSQSCEACRISGATVLPAPVDAFGARLVFIGRSTPPIHAGAYRRHIYSPNTMPRPPPAEPIAI